MSRQERESRKLIEKNAEQIGRFLFLRELNEKQTAGSSFSEEADRVSENATPISEKGWSLMDHPDNMHAHELLAPLLEEMRRTYWVDYRPFQRIEENPGILKQWERQETSHDKEMLRAYTYACRLAAKMLLAKYGPVQIRVRLRRKDEPVSSVREASEKDRRIRTEDSYLRLASQVEKAIAEENCGIEAAKGLVADRMDTSFARVHRAWLYKLEHDREEKGA